MEEFVRFYVMPALVASVSGLLVWVSGLYASHHAHKLHVAETYVKKTEIADRLNEQSDQIKEVRDAINRLTSLVLEAVSGIKQRGQRRD